MVLRSGLSSSDQLLERHVLVRVRAERDFARAPEELAHRGLSGQVGAQRQGVDEEADERLGLDLGASGEGEPTTMSS